MLKRLARAVLTAQKIREESFDDKMADKMQNEDSIIKDFKQCYTKTMEEAVDEAAEKEGVDKRGTLPIYLLNQYCWNDIQAWAEDILK